MHRIIHNVVGTMHMLLKVRKPECKFSGNWSYLMQQLENFRARVKVRKILWEFPPIGWVKYNTDGTSKGNLGVSSHNFCLRNAVRDIIYIRKLHSWRTRQNTFQRQQQYYKQANIVNK